MVNERNADVWLDDSSDNPDNEEKRHHWIKKHAGIGGIFKHNLDGLLVIKVI